MPADCQSAKQQIDNLRYEKSSRVATTPTVKTQRGGAATKVVEGLLPAIEPGFQPGGKNV